MLTPITIVICFHFREGGQERLREFQELAAPVFQEHGLRIVKEFAVSGRGRIGPKPDDSEQPDRIQIATIASLEAFQAYLADPRYLELAPIRASGLRRMVAHLGTSLDMEPVTQRARSGATHVAAFVRFKDETGFDALEAFNRRGVEIGLFPRWGIRVQGLSRSFRSVAAIGETDREAPQAVVHFAMEEPSGMAGYLKDPEYLALAPLRDDAVDSYHFFLGA